MGGKNSKIHGKVPKGEKNLEDENEVTEPLPEPAAPESTDPRLPLDARQVYRLKKNWKGIKRQMGPAGLELFVR